MGASQVLVLEQFLEGKFAKKPSGLLNGLGAKLRLASELAPREERAQSFLTALPALDRLFGGGLLAGSLVELVGRRTAGRFSVGMAALAAATSKGEAAALVDLGDNLDPQSAESAGVDLTRLLWVRPRRIKEALAAAEMLLATGFPLVVADLGLSARSARFLPDAAWLRLARSAHARGSALLLLTPHRMSGIAAEAVLAAQPARPVWRGTGSAPRLLAGVSSRFHLERLGRVTPLTSAPVPLMVPEALGPHPQTPLLPPEIRNVSPPRIALASSLTPDT